MRKTGAPLTPYTGQTTDLTMIYCPYIPLQMGGTMPPPVENRLGLEFREIPGQYWRGAISMVARLSPMAQRDFFIAVGLWCVEHWGAPGFDAPALWYQDGDLLFVADTRLFVEFKLHWWDKRLED